MKNSLTLTHRVKSELCNVPTRKAILRAAEAATILRFAGGLHVINRRLVVEVELDDAQIVQRLRRDLAALYGATTEVATLSNAHEDAPQYIVRISKNGETVARQAGLIDARRRSVRGLPPVLVNGPIEATSALWRGAFLAAGNLTDPGRSAALDIMCPTSEAGMALVGAARRIDVPAKTKEVRGSYRVSIRDPEGIATMLRHMGAKESVTQWESIRERKEVRANVNRLVNFDDANLRRSAQAAVAAGARVARALEILGDDVPEHLRYAGMLRLEHKQASLDELGRLADPPMTKDAVAGRIRRLLSTADKRAHELGLPDTEASIPDELDAS